MSLTQNIFDWEFEIYRVWEETFWGSIGWADQALCQRIPMPVSMTREIEEKQKVNQELKLSLMKFHWKETLSS